MIEQALQLLSRFWHWLIHDAAGFFTLCLVVVGVAQAGLFLWQLRYMRKGLDDTKGASLAAQAAAEAAKEQVAITKMGVIDLERAYLSVGPTQIVLDYIPQSASSGKGYYAPNDPKEITVRLYVHNTGRTAANVKKIYGEFSNILPLAPEYQHVNPIITDISIAAGEKDVLAPFEFKSDYTGPQLFWGYIEYKDIFKNTRTSRFCAHIEPEEVGKPGKYQLAGDDAWRECD
jgi:hypothetical protein